MRLLRFIKYIEAHKAVADAYKNLAKLYGSLEKWEDGIKVARLVKSRLSYLHDDWSHKFILKAQEKISKLWRFIHYLKKYFVEIFVSPAVHKCWSTLPTARISCDAGSDDLFEDMSIQFASCLRHQASSADRLLLLVEESIFHCHSENLSANDNLHDCLTERRLRLRSTTIEILSKTNTQVLVATSDYSYFMRCRR